MLRIASSSAADAASVRRAMRVVEALEPDRRAELVLHPGLRPPRTASGRPPPAPGTGRRAGRSGAPGRRPRRRAGRCPCGTACTGPCLRTSRPRSARARRSAIGGNSTWRRRKRVSPGRSAVALTRPMMSPGIGLLEHGALAAEHRLRVLRGERPPGLRVGDAPCRARRCRSRRARTRPGRGGGVHAGLHLEDEGAERRRRRGGRPSPRDVGVRPARREVEQQVQECGDAEVQQRRGEQHRRRARRRGSAPGRGRRRRRRAARAPRRRSPSRPASRSAAAVGVQPLLGRPRRAARGAGVA